MRMVLQLLRPVVLVGVLLASGPLLRRLAFTFETGFPDAAHWPSVVAVMVVFAAVTVIGRHRASPAVLAVEAVVAVPLAFVPPVQWVLWFGVGTFTVFTDATGGAFGPVGLMQPLATMWLAVVLVTAIDLVRGGRSPERSEASVS